MDCVFSVIFPNNLPYFDDYCRSLVAQSSKDFSVFLCNDGVPELDNILLQYPQLDFKVHEVKGSIPAVRAWALERLASSAFANIHFLDTDDYVPNNYIEVKRALLSVHPLVVSDLFIVDQRGQLLKPHKIGARLDEGFVIDQEYLKDKNVMGMSNTSIRRELLYPITIPEGLVAVDWYVFFKLIKGHYGVFTKQTYTSYRQHGANTLGDGTITPQYILKKTEAMIAHMMALASEYLSHRELLHSLHSLRDKLLADDDTLVLAQKSLSKAEIDYFWFEDISSLLYK